MGAAAKLHGPGTTTLFLGHATHLDNADLIAVFLAEQGQRTKLDGGVGGHDAGRDITVHADAFIDDLLHACKLVRLDGARMREIEPQPVRRDKRSLLRDMIAKHMTKRLMQKMCRRMVGAKPATAVMINLQTKACAHRQLAVRHLGAMNEHAGRRLEGIGDAGPAAIPAD